MRNYILKGFTIQNESVTIKKPENKVIVVQAAITFLGEDAMFGRLRKAASQRLGRLRRDWKSEFLRKTSPSLSPVPGTVRCV